MIQLKRMAKTRQWLMTLALSLVISGCGGGDPILGNYDGSNADIIRPTVTATTPAMTSPGPTAGPAINAAITATFSESMDPATINLTSFTVVDKTAGGISVLGSVSYVESTKTVTFVPNTDFTAGNTYAATLIGTGSGAITDLAGNALSGNTASSPDASDNVWSFSPTSLADVTAPTVTLTFPVTADPMFTAGPAVNAAITATFSEKMDAGSINTLSFTVIDMTAGGIAVPGTVSYTASSKSVRFKPDTAFTADNTYTARILGSGSAPVTDLAGNVLAGNGATFPTASDYVWSFAPTALPDLTAPTVTLTFPATSDANPTTGPAVNAAITATFSEIMDPVTIDTLSFTVVDTTAGGIAVPGSVSYIESSKSVRFKPNTAFTADNTYTATILGTGATPVTDLAGNPLSGNSATFPAASDYVWSFAPTALPDLTAPTVTLTFPATTNLGLTVGPAINAAITATFSEIMDPISIDTLSFTVVDATAGGIAVPGSVSYIESSKTVRFQPSAAFTADNTYTATITGTGSAPVTDLAGNALSGNGADFPEASDYVWSFAPTALPDVTAPTVALTYPATVNPGPSDGPTVNAAITVTFSESMDPVTIDTLSFTVVDTTAGGTAMPGVVNYIESSKTVRFRPNADFTAGRTYTATVTGTGSTPVTDLAGNPLSGNTGNFPAPSDYAWSFTPTALPDLTAPTVTLTFPATSDASPTVGPAINAAITATFSELMDPISINTLSFIVVDAAAGGIPVAGSVSYIESSKSVRFKPNTPFTADKTYTATIKGTGSAPVTDLAGNALAGNTGTFPAASDYVWSFAPTALPDTTAPTIALTYPATVNSGPSDGPPVNAAITATFSEIMDPVSIDSLSFTVVDTTAGGIAVAGSVSYLESSKSVRFKPDTAFTADNTYTATIKGTGSAPVTDLAGNALAGNTGTFPAASDYVWSFAPTALLDVTAPTVTLTFPVTVNSGSTAGPAINAAITATFSEIMDPVTIDTLSFTVIDATAGGIAVPGSVSYIGSSKTVRFKPTTPFIADNTYFATIAGTGVAPVTDLAGNALAGNTGTFPAASDYVWYFAPTAISDLTAPTVSLTFPSTANPGPAVGPPLNAAIYATFSESMDPITIDTLSFTVVDTTAGGIAVPGIVNYIESSMTVRFRPNADFAIGNTYTATIAGTGAAPVTDLAGNALSGNTATFPAANDYVWSFAPTELPDLTSPTVTLTFPVTENPGPVSGPAVNESLTVTFSEKMDPVTIDNQSFIVVNTTNGGIPMDGVVNYIESSKTLRFKTDQPFVAGNTYTATIKGTGSNPATDLAGNALSGNTDVSSLTSDYVWSFNPTALTDLISPTVTMTFPATADPGPTIGPAINAAITATFSESMDPISINTLSFTVVDTTAGGTAVPGSVIYVESNKTVRFKPNTAFTADNVYTATIVATGTAPVTDLAGNAVLGNTLPLPTPSNYVWTFAPTALPDLTAPMVTVTFPETADPGPANGPAINAAITATFSEIMDPTTIDTQSFTVVDTTAGGISVLGNVTYNETSKTVKFKPNAEFNAGNTYTATIAGTGAAPVTDLAGNALAGNTAPLPDPSDYVWSFIPNALPDMIAPTVTLTFPADGDIDVSLNSAINATFDEAMDNNTIDSASFTLEQTANPGVFENGLVTYDPVQHIATFNPSSDLAISTQYTATITTDVTDLAGNAIVPGIASNPWVFTTGNGLAPGAIVLGSVGTFGIMATAAITSIGNSVVNGDVSLDPGTSMTGFPPALVNGTIHINDTVSEQARLDLLKAYNDAKALPPGTTISAGADLGALYPSGMPPGTYTSGSSMLVSSNLVLDAGGNANAVWVFQIGSSLSTTANVTLLNGAQAKNVFWVPTLDATIGVATTFSGTIVSGRDVTAVTGTTINGRILAGATTGGTIALQTTIVNVPAP